MDTSDLRARLAAALREAAKLCDEDCADEAACDAAHPIQAAVLHFDVITDVYGPVDALAALAAAVVQPELDRLRAEVLREAVDRIEEHRAALFNRSEINVHEWRGMRTASNVIEPKEQTDA